MKTQRTLIGLAVTALLVISGAPVAHAQADAWATGAPVARWTESALAAVATAGTGDAGAARTYAMVDAAMYDAVNGLLPQPAQRTAAIVAPQPGASGDPAVAAAAAAHDILVALYQGDAQRFDDQLATDIATAPSADAAERGAEWGHFVATQVLAARDGDGSVGQDPQPGGTEPGEFDRPWDTQPRHLTPFVIANPDAYVDHGDPAAFLRTPAYAKSFDKVKRLGDARREDPDADATFRFWSLGTRTEQPPGAWLRVATTVAAQRSLNLADTARLLALEAMALADTVAPTYATKALWHFWRPVAAIAGANADDNPATKPARYTWVARGGTSGSPEHWSGHSSFSAAAATVLAGFFGTDDIGFDLTTGSSGGVTRHYASFSEAATEAGLSRILGGLHFPFSNGAGLASGQGVANEVLAHALLPGQR